MKLLLDVGNTAVKWCLADKGRLTDGERFIHSNTAFDVQAEQAWSGLATPDEIVVANVAGVGMVDTMTRWVSQKWQQSPQFIEVSKAACGVTNAYKTPGDLGIDRWAAMVGAHHACSGAVCVVDCGTAITIDTVAASGEHLGGLILPGADLLQRTLLENTDGTHAHDALQPCVLLATSTADAVNSGALYLAAAAIDRVVSQVRDVAGETLVVLVTGGDAGRIVPLLQITTQQEPDLVLQGLAILSDGGA